MERACERRCPAAAKTSGRASAVAGLAFAAAALISATHPASGEGAASMSAFTIAIPKTSDPPPIDGSIDHAAWRAAAHVPIQWNIDFHRLASDATEAYLTTDGAYLYVAFVATQKAPVLATQRTNGKAVDSDDWVAVFLWPGGVNGFQYMFKCNAIGVCFQSSSENADFEPIWKSAGRVAADGFVVTMRIPLDVMRGDAGDQWRVQFARQVNRTGDGALVWAYASGMDNEGQAVYAGYVSGMRGLGASLRPRPRLAIYGLGGLIAPSAGGNTSRIGADFAVPISRTASVLGTAHPDYSNVELDQQTIAPTVFRREIREVRPFFTQGSNFYNKFSAIADPGNIMLYTPGIPTPADGFAAEGTHGNYGLAGFDATSHGRSDAAQTVSWSSSDNVVSAALQRVTVDMPGFTDRATGATVLVDNQRDAFAYADFATDAGTNVVDPNQGRWEEIGAASHGPTSFLGAAARKIGAYYNPSDGFVSRPDIAGWAGDGEQELLPRWGPIQSVALQTSIDRYHDVTGAVDEADQSVRLSIQTRSQFSFSGSTGSDFLLSGVGGAGGFFDQNGLSIGYRDHTTTPTDVSYNVGRFGDGFLRAWARSVSLQVGARGSVSLEADDTDLSTDRGETLKQWLERAAYSYQFGPQASFAIGVRRIIGTSPPVFSDSSYVDASNVSIALHDRIGPDDVYLVYGDASMLSTPPELLLKWVHYFGAEKGT